MFTSDNLFEWRHISFNVRVCFIFLWYLRHLNLEYYVHRTLFIFSHIVYSCVLCRINDDNGWKMDPYPSNFEILWDARKLNAAAISVPELKVLRLLYTLCTKSYLQQNNINATDNRIHNHNSSLLPSFAMHAIVKS